MTPRLARPHFDPVMAEIMWTAMEDAHRELSKEEWREYAEKEITDVDDISMERLGRWSELQSMRKGYPDLADRDRLKAHDT